MKRGAMLPRLLALSLDGLRRKPGRNLLTASGVFIGVFALTLIVALGEGMTGLIQSTVSSEENLRQIGLSPGFGSRIGGEDDIDIRGDMPEDRRERLRRAAVARSRPGTFIGRRPQSLDARRLAEIKRIPHVETVIPIVLERYRLKLGTRQTAATATVGVDVGRRRYEDRVIAGAYFSGPGAREVLLHEYLAYQWDLLETADLETLVGQTIVLETIQNENPADLFGPGFLMEFMNRADLSVLTEEELDLLPGMVEKLWRSLWGMSMPEGDAEASTTERHELTVVGIVRGLGPSDTFNVIEDGNAFQADLYFPQQVAVDMFLASPVNRELGFGRAVVVVDESRHAQEAENALRDAGYTAFSVASVVSRIEEFLGALTVIVAFLTGIALLVAGLGIVNTMVTSVIERTREIGLWKAIGATSGQVRTVFLLEAAALGLFGGLLGLGAALLVMVPAEDVAGRMIAERSSVPLQGSVFRVPYWLPLAGPLLSMLLAMLAALYPAHRGARVDPVTALHHE